jgi:hypothetical protein
MQLGLVPVVQELEVAVVQELVVLVILPTRKVSAELEPQEVEKYFLVLVVALDRILVLVAVAVVLVAVQTIMFTVLVAVVAGVHLVADLPV